MSAEPQNPTLPPEAQNQPQPAPGLFTAAQIAAALGPGSKRGILKSLRGVPITGERLVRGQSAGTRSLCALPVALQTRIEGAAQARGFRNAEALLHACGAPARVPPAEVAANPGVASARDLHSDLRAYFDDFLENRSSLSRDDRACVWRRVCWHYEAIAAAGAATGAASNRGELSGSLLEFLAREVPGLVKRGAKNPGRALKRDFQRKLARFRKDGPGALRDGREARSGNYREILCPDCWEKALASDVAFAANESLAWRTLKSRGLLCGACGERHKLDMRGNKSYVPTSIRGALTPLVDSALPWLKSNAAGRMAGPAIPRNWDDTEPGDWFEADDMTGNELVSGFDERGKICLFRPECLVMADAKSGYPMAWRLIRGNYNGRDVRMLMADAIIKCGLPRRGFRFENGIWRSCVARDESRKGFVDFRDTVDGFKSLGTILEPKGIHHCRPRNPRGKAGLEGFFGILQERMQIQRGHVGFNEREAKSDAIKEAVRATQGGDKKALAQFLTFSEWAERLEATISEWASEPGNGARNDGISPLENWQAGVNRAPLREIPENARWILSTHRDVAKVTKKGIVIDYGRHERWLYAGDRLKIGSQVLAHYHIDRPEVLTVCDMKRTEYFCAKGIRLPATTATPEQIAEAEREIAAFNRVPRTIAGMLKHPVISLLRRDNEFPEAQLEHGRELEKAKSEVIETARRREPTQEQQRREAAERFEMKRASLNSASARVCL
jgi:hypothetical protein